MKLCRRCGRGGSDNRAKCRCGGKLVKNVRQSAEARGIMTALKLRQFLAGVGK